MHAAARGPKSDARAAQPLQEAVLVLDAVRGEITYASPQAADLVAAALGSPAPARIADWPDAVGRAALTAVVASEASTPSSPLAGWSVAAVRHCGRVVLLTLARAAVTGDATFRGLVDHSVIGVVIHRRFKPLYANRAFARLFGFASPDAVLADDLFRLAERPPGQTRDEAWAQLVETTQPEQGRRRPMLRADGTSLVVDFRYRWLTWEGEAALVASVVDASDRQSAEDAMARLHRQLFEALDAISDGFALWDADDRLIVGNRKLDRVTPLSTGIFQPGVSFAEAMRQHVKVGEFKLDEGEDIEEFVAQRTALHQAHRHNREMLTSSGDWYLITERPTCEGGIVGVYTNITELKAVQADLAAERTRAEAASAAKSQFLAMMSHELRTPMTGILGLLDLLMTTALTPEQATYIGQLEGSAQALLSLLNDLLDYSKIEAGRLEIERVPFAIRHTLRDVCALFNHAACSGGNSLVVDVDPAVPEAARGDPGRVRQILVNLIGNAVKFTDHGCITVRVSHGGDHTGTDAFTLKVEVSDTGIGIDDEQIGQLFNAFTQADASTTRRFGGTGLGLAICRNLLDAMGGRIAVTSALGHGSVFTFELPLEACAAAEVQPAARSRASLDHDFAGVRVLLAEDNALNRSLITAMLRKMGFAVDAVANGALAVEAAAGQPGYDLVLMDMQMPVMDGPAAAQAIRALSDRHRALPILALTADAMPEHRHRYLAAGLDGVLTKPIAWEELSAMVQQMLARPRAAAGEAAGAPRTARVDWRGHEGRAASNSDSPVLDRAMLDALMRAVSGPPLVDLLDRMMAAARDALVRIRAARAAADLPALHCIAHELKGMAANFGAARLAAIAAALQCSQRDTPDIDHLIAALEPAVDATAAALRPFCDEVVAA